MMQISADWIRQPDSQKLCQMLSNAGYECYFVGGCVRNALLGVPVNDIDIATNAHPEQVIALARAAGLKPIPTGIDHGTVTVISGGHAFEVTTYRQDVKTDGRHAVVSYSDSIAQDALRRDFTMNALYADRFGAVVDPLNGLPDLLARRVRFIENPQKRIQEDYLRIMRFFRFHAWYGAPDQGLDAEGLAACAANLTGLETVSNERIGAELCKLLAATDPGPSVAAMAASGVLNTILPGAEAKALPVLIHLEASFPGPSLPPNAIRRLAVLGGENAKSRLRLSNAQAKQLAVLRNEAGSLHSPARLGFEFGAETAIDIVLLRAALLETTPDPGAWQQIEIGVAAEFPVKPADLMPRFQGKALGDKLAELQEKWLQSGFALSKDQLLR